MQGREKLKLACSGDALGVPPAEWSKALGQAAPDAVVGIRHAALSGDAAYRLHVAAIPKQVGCHFHAKGDEDYAVVAGSGTLFWGKVQKDAAGGWKVAWEEPVDVTAGDSFVIPEGYAHQLRKRGGDDLVIVFGCPDDHLNDSADRTMLPDAPAKHPPPPSAVKRPAP